MSYVVIKAFQTTLRRLKVGDAVNDGDELAPHTVESLKDAGLIGVETESSPAAAPSPSHNPVQPAPGED